LASAIVGSLRSRTAFVQSLLFLPTIPANRRTADAATDDVSSAGFPERPPSKVGDSAGKDWDRGGQRPSKRQRLTRDDSEGGDGDEAESGGNGGGGGGDLGDLGGPSLFERPDPGLGPGLGLCLRWLLDSDVATSTALKVR
jgi:hypothetical protein